MALTLTSQGFTNGSDIPTKYTCDGENVSPALAWKDVPSGTKSLALIVDDPDAPVGTWVHWVLFNIPPDATALPETASSEPELADGSRNGTNDFKTLGYGGPCPPKGAPHRYFFKLYALDRKLDLPSGAKKAQVEKAIEGHILAQTELMGRYARH